MKHLKSWLLNYKKKAALFIVAYIFILFFGIKDDTQYLYIIPLVVLSLAWWATYISDLRKIGLYLLIGALILSDLPAKAAESPKIEKQAVGPACAGTIAVVVIVVGGIIIVKIVRFCQKYFSPPPPPPDTNAPPAQVTSCGSMSCHPPYSCIKLTDDTPTTRTYFQIIYKNNNLVIQKDESEFVEYNKFTEYLNNYGLRITPERYYTLNNVQIPEEDSLLRIEDPNSFYLQGENMKEVLIEKSIDLKNWEVYMLAKIPDWYQMEIGDSSEEGEVFYRAHTKPLDFDPAIR